MGLSKNNCNMRQKSGKETVEKRLNQVETFQNRDLEIGNSNLRE